VFDTLRNRYDLILLDVPALLPVADAVTLIPYCDGVVLVVMAGKTSRPHLTRTREIVVGMGARILGIVIGNIKEAAPESFDPSYYYANATPLPARDEGGVTPDDVD
jgi:Mrp family chromosome partitioning ATPase